MQSLSESGSWDSRYAMGGGHRCHFVYYLAGLSIGGETEVVLLSKRMRELAGKLGEDGKMLRFWGKILSNFGGFIGA